MPRAALVALLVALALPIGVASLPAGVAGGDAAPDAGAPTVGGPTVAPPATAAATGDRSDAAQVTATPAGGAVTSGPVADLADIAILTLNGTARSGFADESMDVGTALAVQHEGAEARLDRYALAERFAATSSTEARKTLLFEAATSVEIRITSLRDDERRLRADYANRTIDTETYVRRLARLDARADQLRATLAAIQTLADDVPQFSIRGRVRLLGAQLYGFEGPVRQRALAAMHGEGPPTRLYVAVSERGVVLSTIDRGTFVRESFRADHRDPETVGGMSLNEAVERTEQLYPVAYNSTESIRTGINGLSGGLYQIEIELRQGLVTAVLDGSTGDVFYEVQERRLDLVESPLASTGVDNGTRLVANRSFAGGPMRLAVSDDETGQPLSTTVYVAGYPVPTGSDGVVWTLAPNEPVEVTAVGPRGNVTISVRPLPPTPVGSADTADGADG